MRNNLLQNANFPYGQYSTADKGFLSMSSSTLHQKLLTMRQLTFKAIYSDESRTTLRELWQEVETSSRCGLFQQEERQLLARLSHSHNALANTMSSLETCLGDLLSDTRQELDTGRAFGFDNQTYKPALETGDPLRAWIYHNILFPFPSMFIRKQLQVDTDMSMSNINGWFGNMRRRCGWNAMCSKWTKGNRTGMRELMRRCFVGEETNEELIKEISDVIDYVMGRAKGKVGSWLTEIVGEEVHSLDRFTGIKLDFPPAKKPEWKPSKRQKATMESQPIRRVQDQLSDSDEEDDEDDDSPMMEVESRHPASVLAPTSNSHISFHPGSFTQKNVVSHPYRSFSGSSDGSTISNISAISHQIHSRVPSYDYSQVSGSQYTSSPINGHQHTLPITFGGPPQSYAFQPQLPALEQPRRPKRGVQQMDGDEADMRAFKFARFG